MAAEVAPSKNTGGGGFVFEDDVCAWLLACMLAGESVFDSRFGPPIRVDFQTRPDGWFLDDVLLTTDVDGVQHRFAVSIKSNSQFTASSAPADFVRDIGEQWLHIGSSVFDHEVDFLVLVTSPLSTAAKSSLSGLGEKLLDADPEAFPSRLAAPRWASQDERSLFSSFACPEDINTGELTDVDTARLVQRVRFLQRDFCDNPSDSLKAALEVCRRSVVSHGPDDAQNLWNVLKCISSELRPHAGSLSFKDLTKRLRTQVSLADHPDHASDWEKLDSISHQTVVLVRDSIAGRIRISRAEQAQKLQKAVAENQFVAVLGASGVGKSALVKGLFERRRGQTERTLWLDARSFDCSSFSAFESTLGLKYQLKQLFGLARARSQLLVVDGLDRLYSEKAFRVAATILSLVCQEAPGQSWGIVVNCQTQEWPRVLEALIREGYSAGPWAHFPLRTLTPEEFGRIVSEVPGIEKLVSSPRVPSALSNLKLLDLVVRQIDAGAAVDSVDWIGESSVADWFWNSEIDRGTDRMARKRFARTLAQLQADQLTASILIDDPGIDDLAPFESLAADQLCVQAPGDRIAFAHDLYGDWSRLQILVSHRSDLATYVRGRHESPLWHRALRLYGVYLLERKDGIAEWKRLLSSISLSDMGVAHDALLEAPVFAANAKVLLDAVIPQLVAENGALLQRLLKRVLAFGTVPNVKMVDLASASGMDVSLARAKYRLPYKPYWEDVLRVLQANKKLVLEVAPNEVALVVRMWLSSTPKGAVLRAEAADLAVSLGRLALSYRDQYLNQDWEENRKIYYECALLAAFERPDEVSDIALEGAERKAPSDERTEGVPSPWPDGPFTRVDDAFRDVVLNGSAIRELARVRPDVVREVALASLIEEPGEMDPYYDWGGRRSFSVRDCREWLPGLYFYGPFLMLLKSNFSEGLELIVRFVDFAAQQAWEYAVPTEVKLLGDSEELIFDGSDKMFGWSAGLGNPPYAIQSALMALEQYFYMRLNDGHQIAGEVAAVLARARCAAFLGVLCDVGKRDQGLFKGPLRPLLSAPEIYFWDLSKGVSGRHHLMIGALQKGDWFVSLAKMFHDMEHRNVDLRHIAVQQMLSNKMTQEFFDRVRVSWRDVSVTDEIIAKFLQNLIVALDPENYERREDPIYGTVLVNFQAESDRREHSEEYQAMDDQTLIIRFPLRCRMILDDKTKQNDEQLVRLWLDWLRIRELATKAPELPDGRQGRGDEYANAICGGVAVFLWHSDWYSADSGRQQELETALFSILNDPPNRDCIDTDDTLATWIWECFVAEACAMLWIRNPSEERWRRLVADAVFSPKYQAVRSLFSVCAEHRGSLGDDFGRLRRLVLEWAYLRVRLSRIRSAIRGGRRPDDVGLNRLLDDCGAWCEEKIAEFVMGRTTGFPSDWNECDESGHFDELDAKFPGMRETSRMDFRVLRWSHDWLPLPDDARSPSERAEVISFWRMALAFVAKRPIEEQKLYQNPYPRDDDMWVLERLGAVLLQLRSDEAPDVLWTRIFDLSGDACSWPKFLLSWLHLKALTADEVPATYSQLVRDMAHYSLETSIESTRWAPSDSIWDELLGIDPISHELWQERHSEIVEELSDVFLLWMDRVPVNGRRLGRFAVWLCRAAGKPIRPRALRWIRDNVRVNERRDLIDVDEAEDAIARLLGVIWEDSGACPTNPCRSEAGWLY